MYHSNNGEEAYFMESEFEDRSMMSSGELP